jgi:hypothetical protein
MAIYDDRGKVVKGMTSAAYPIANRIGIQASSSGSTARTNNSRDRVGAVAPQRTVRVMVHADGSNPYSVTFSGFTQRPSALP